MSSTVPKGYWIGHVDVRDADAYGQYSVLAVQAVQGHGGRYLVRRGSHEVPEGGWRTIHVMIEFDSYQRALDCYHSDEYQMAKRLREGAAIADLLIIEGSGEDC